MSFTRGRNLSHAKGFPKPGDETLVDAPGRHNRDGWTHVTDHSSTYIEGKQYRNMREWKRPCVICAGSISAFEKTGQVDANSRFSNRTCKEHRGLTPAFEKGFIAWNEELRGIVPGPSCVSKDVPAASTDEADALRMANSVMKEELTGLYASRNELHALYEGALAELQVLKAKLAPYDLPAAMAAVVPPAKTYKLPAEPLTMAQATANMQAAMAAVAPFNPHALLAAEIAIKNKMPWDT